MPVLEKDQLGRVIVEIELVNNEDLVLAKAGAKSKSQVRRAKITGVVDTGAAHLVIPKQVADRLGFPSGEKAHVRYADLRRATRSVVEQVHVELMGRHGIFRAIVEPRRKDALIGAIVLEDLDFVVDCRKQTLAPRDPKNIVSEIE